MMILCVGDGMGCDGDADDDGDDGDEEEDDCEGHAPRADVLFERRRPPCWIHGQQVSPSSSIS